jgi:outer membrane protein TolC
VRTRATVISATVLSFVLGSVGSTAAAQAPTSTFDQLLDRELAVEGGLTAEDAARSAGETSPDLRARNAELAAAIADVDRATLAYVPQTTLMARYARLSPIDSGNLGNIVAAPNAPAGPIPAGSQLVNVPLTFDTPLNQITFQASLLVPISDYFLRVAPGREAASYGADAAKGGVETARVRALADARVAYYAWVRARLGVVVAEQAFSQSQAHLGDAKAMLAAGTLSQADVMRIESEVAKSELFVTSSRHLSELTEEQLRTAMHAPADRVFHVGEDIRTPPSDRPHPPLKSLWQEALAARPELKALDAAQSGREVSIDVDRAGYLPRVDLFANAQYSNPNQRVFPSEAEFRATWDAGAQLTWTLSELPSTGARVRAAEARHAAKAAERADVADRVRVEVMSARQASDEARVAQQTTARGLAAAEESYRARNLLFQNGRATTVELLDSETDLTRARLEALSARIDARVASVRLAYALGRRECLTPAVRGTKYAATPPGCP